MNRSGAHVGNRDLAVHLLVENVKEQAVATRVVSTRKWGLIRFKLNKLY